MHNKAHTSKKFKMGATVIFHLQGAVTAFYFILLDGYTNIAEGNNVGYKFEHFIIFFKLSRFLVVFIYWLKWQVSSKIWKMPIKRCWNKYHKMIGKDKRFYMITLVSNKKISTSISHKTSTTVLQNVNKIIIKLSKEKF